MRYATSEGITLTEAKKKIDAVDVQMFQQKAKQYVENKDFSDKANAELRAYNTKMYVSREKLLQAQLGLIVTYAYAQIEQSMYNYMESAYYRALEQQAGILGETLRVSINDVKTIIFTPLKGINGVQDFGQIWTLLEDTYKRPHAMYYYVVDTLMSL